MHIDEAATTPSPWSLLNLHVRGIAVSKLSYLALYAEALVDSI
jgi:hypothetical protein